MQIKPHQIKTLLSLGILVPVFLFSISFQAHASFPSDGRAIALRISTSDPFFTTNASDENFQWYLEKIRVPEAWDYSRGSSSVIVAIVDTGIHAGHVELNDGRVIEGWNTITNSAIPAGANSDDNGHGTAVAGIIGAISDNHKGIAGINQNVKIMPVKALNADGTGDLSDVAEGIIWATEHGASIINLSLGGTSFGSGNSLFNAITYAYDHSVLVVAAAGNDQNHQGINLDNQPAYPVCADNGKNMVMGVAATDINDQRADFSDYGFNCIDISAPGKKILTTAYLPAEPSDNVLIYGSGTSVAAPIVAGVAALVKAANPTLTNVQIQNLLMQTATDIYPVNQTTCAGTSCNGFLGKGRINALAALTPQLIPNGTLIKEVSTGNIYLVVNNTKRFVSSFVFTQRGFLASNVSNETNAQLLTIPLGSPLLPLDGTLLKGSSSAIVYVVHQELLRPVTYATFVSRHYSFANVITRPDSEIEQYPKGDWYWPADGTAVLVAGSPLVYIMDKQVARPVTFTVFTQRGLSFANVLRVSQEEFTHIPRPADNYWLPPLDGTLIKSADSPAVYVIYEGTRHALSSASFSSRGFRFEDIKVLPQAEVDIIGPGVDL